MVIKLQVHLCRGPIYLNKYLRIYKLQKMKNLIENMIILNRDYEFIERMVQNRKKLISKLGDETFNDKGHCIYRSPIKCT